MTAEVPPRPPTELPSPAGAGASEAVPAATRLALRCPVRGCGEPLGREDRRLVCRRGHAFDRARSGYFNLLQPQDRRSATPGDSRAAAEARRRLYAAGHGEPLLAELRRHLARALAERPRAASAAPFTVLDVGCGEGWLLGELVARAAGGAGATPLDGHGVDLSSPALELAARRYPALTWVVANADRALPYSPAGCDLVLSLSARLPAAELRRVVAPTGRLLVAVPGPDDLVELRAALLGTGEQRDRLQRAAERLDPAFALAERSLVRHLAELDGEGVRDVLAATYRGERHRQRERLETIGGLRVTMSFAVGLFAPKEFGDTIRIPPP